MSSCGSSVSSVCNCSVGYYCECAEKPDGPKQPKKRKYTYSDAESSATTEAKAKKLMEKRADADYIRCMLATHSSLEGRCCAKGCIRKLYTTHGEKLVDAVLYSWSTIYVRDQNRSFEKLRLLLAEGLDLYGDQTFLFDHNGHLPGDAKERVCSVAWEKLHSVSHHRRLKIQREVKDQGSGVHLRQSQDRSFSKPRESARQFLTIFFSDEGGRVEEIPFHNGNSETMKRHLPPWFSVNEVYKYYQEYAAERLAELVGKLPRPCLMRMRLPSRL